MSDKIPSTETVRGLLQRLRLAEMDRIAVLSGVPFATLMKIRTGQTMNPGIETVRKFMPLLERSVQHDQAA